MSEPSEDVGVLFVCMGNICRSPTAHGVFRHRAGDLGLEDRIRIESAGTHGFHVGHGADRRAQEAARRRGYAFDDLRARQIEPGDLARFDYVLAMDRDNLAHVEGMREAGGGAEVALLLDYTSDFAGRDVPDPYYGALNGFEEVLDLVEAGTDALLAHLRERHGL